MFDVTLPENLPGWPKVAARVILKHSVALEIAGYCDRQETTKLILLDLPEIRKSLKQGEVRFGSRDLQAPEVDFQFAYRAALEAALKGTDK